MSRSRSRRCGDGQEPLGGILVGGTSRRFGSDKATTLVVGRPMVDRVAEAMRGATDRIVLLGRAVQTPGCGDLEWIPDAAGQGPLAGIASGLSTARTMGRPGLLVAACDLPLLSGSELSRIASSRSSRHDAVTIAPRPGDVGPPLLAWLGTQALHPVVELLRSGSASVQGLLRRLRVLRLDPDGDGVRSRGWPSYWNVNRPGDLIGVEDVLADEGR